MSLLHHRTTPALASVLSTDDSMWEIAHGNRYAGGEPLSVKLELLVKPDGQPAFKSETRIRGRGGFGLTGHDTYVLYDPENPGHCDIDADRLTREFGANATAVIPHIPTHDVVQDTDPEAVAPASAPQDAMVHDLEQLGTLHADGTLTDDEFAAAKARLLNADPAA